MFVSLGLGFFSKGVMSKRRKGKGEGSGRTGQELENSKDGAFLLTPLLFTSLQSK